MIQFRRIERGGGIGVYLNAFSVFLTVVEEMNFTRAAERLFISQQALSGYIKRLETHYGVTLFQRKPNLKLTAEGEAMVLCARQLLETETELERRLADITENAASVLTFGISHQRSGTFFPGIWNQFHTLHPNISVRLHERMTDKLLDELQSNRVDLMVGLDIGESANLTVLPLVEEHMRCVLSEVLLRRLYPDDWEQMLERFRRDGVTVEDLREAPLLLLPEDNRIRASIDRLFFRHRVLPNVALECSQQTVLFQAACCAGGVAVIDPINIYQELRFQHAMPPRCHSFQLRDAPVNVVSLAFRRDIPQPQYVLDLAQCVQEEFRDYSDLLELHEL